MIKLLSKSFYVRFVFTALLLCSGGTVSWSQSVSQNEELVEKATQLIYSNPDETIKIGEHLLKSHSSDSEKAVLDLLIAESYGVKGNYNSGIMSVFEAGKYFKTIEDTLKIKVLLLKSVFLRELYLDSQSTKYLQDAEVLVSTLNPNEAKTLFQAKIILNKIEMNLERRRSQEAQDLIKQNDLLFRKLGNGNPNIQQDFNIVKARTFSSFSEHDSATVYFDKAFQFSQNRKYANAFEKATVLNELGKLYFQKKEHTRSIALLLEALDIAKKINNIPLLKSINRQLAVNYLALNNRANYQSYSNEFLRLNNILERYEQESVNTAFNLISQEQEYYFEDQRDQYGAYLYMTLAVCIMVLLVCFVFWLKMKSKKKRLREIVKYLEISRNIFAKTNAERKEPNKKIIIPIETEQALLAKLKRFEGSTKFTNNEMSLAVLAGQFDTNTKYLSEIINKHYQDNFNTYINKLRINFIIQKLKTDPNYMHYKISYLAEKCGFSSHSSFATVFKSITGIAPVTFIDLLKEETEQNNKEIV